MRPCHDRDLSGTLLQQTCSVRPLLESVIYHPRQDNILRCWLRSPVENRLEYAASPRCMFFNAITVARFPVRRNMADSSLWSDVNVMIYSRLLQESVVLNRRQVSDLRLEELAGVQQL